MTNFNGILICTDLDGTLLRSDRQISDENKKAIEYFKAHGGYFTFVTGRMPFFVDDIVERVNPNAPIGCVNGGGLYDTVKNEYMWQSTMPDGVNTLIKCIDENFPNVGIQVNSFNHVYFARENVIMEEFRNTTGVENLVCKYDEVKEPVAKIVFGVETEEEISAMRNMLESHPLAVNFDFIRSEQYLFEILPKGINKGTSIQKLCECLGIDKNKTVAIGDYNNDIPMFLAAKAGIAVSNACDDALKAADFITVSNDENAVARVIYDIEKGKYL